MSEDFEQRRIRLAKLEELRRRGRDPFLIERYPRSHVAADIVARVDELMDETVSVAGRVTALRAMGKACFLDVTDETGRIQVYVRRDDVGDEAYADIRDLDLGDIVGVSGFVFRTRTGEISIHARECVLLAKCLRPLPFGKAYDGRRKGDITDPELRRRLRYVDFIVHPEARALIEKRALMTRAIRNFLDSRGFLEVETPVLQEVAGGAAARPFVTHHNAYDKDYKLRISLELPLKRLIVGGFPRVYEIGRVFRNESISSRHNPEFTLLELYEAYANLEDIMELVEEMYVAACVAVNGCPTFTTTVEEAGGVRKVDVDVAQRPWRRLSMLDALKEYAGVSRDELRDLDSARSVCERLDPGHRHIKPELETSVGGIMEKLLETYVQPHLVEPTFITDYPLETSPLAKKHPDDPTLTRRFEVYMACQELGNAFSELNDPVDQRERFEDQARRLAAGDEEAHPLDEDFLRALECGMPPTGGLGVGIDRLIMVLTDAPSIREVLAFPLLRPEH